MAQDEVNRPKNNIERLRKQDEYEVLCTIQDRLNRMQYGRIIFDSSFCILSLIDGQPRALECNGPKECKECIRKWMYLGGNHYGHHE